MTDCPHGMPSPASCWDCMFEGNLPPRPQPRQYRRSKAFPASYRGHCLGCGEPIQEGDDIVFMSDDTYRHHECAEE